MATTPKTRQDSSHHTKTRQESGRHTKNLHRKAATTPIAVTLKTRWESSHHTENHFVFPTFVRKDISYHVLLIPFDGARTAPKPSLLFIHGAHRWRNAPESHLIILIGVEKQRELIWLRTLQQMHEEQKVGGAKGKGFGSEPDLRPHICEKRLHT